MARRRRIFCSRLDRALPGVSLSSQTGNDFQLDLNYRGYTAAPVIGTPQGLAVYQNGVRINEVFGDVVNWDFIPQSAINQLTLVPSNPVYGLNATGGALAFEMKNGYTYHAVEGELSGGSYGRAVASVQAGGEIGNLSGYITADAINDAGWRNNSPSSLRRVYADLGARGEHVRPMHCVRHALVVQTRFTINILNYRKNGTRFVNRLRMRPIFDEQGKLP